MADERRPLLNASVIVPTDDLHDADGMMLTADGAVKPAVDLLRRGKVHSVTLTGTKPDPGDSSSASPSS